MKKTIGFILFDQYHQRKNIGGSRIRGHWIIKNMPEAELFVQGKDYETVIYQKVYWKEHLRTFKGQKILDICDPDWLEGMEIVSILKEVHAVIVPTEELKKALRNMTDKQIYVVPDRVDFEGLPKPKKHKGKAKKIVWFGYAHNTDVLDQTLFKVNQLGLELIVISDGQYRSNDCRITNVKWELATVNQEIQKADFALLPEFKHGRWKYKSQNKTVQCWSLGIPVAKSMEELVRFMDEKERQKEAEERYKEAKEKFDVKLSVKELREII